jgi:hypothetical protein
MCRLNNNQLDEREGYRTVKERGGMTTISVNNNQLDKQEGYHRQRRNDNLPSKQQASCRREGYNIEDVQGMPKR